MTFFRNACFGVIVALIPPRCECPGTRRRSARCRATCLAASACSWSKSRRFPAFSRISGAARPRTTPERSTSSAWRSARATEGHLVWGVIAATSGVPAAALAGKYAGVGANASIGAGAGANILVGGSGNAFSLQPISVEGQIGNQHCGRRHDCHIEDRSLITGHKDRNVPLDHSPAPKASRDRQLPDAVGARSGSRRHRRPRKGRETNEYRKDRRCAARCDCGHARRHTRESSRCGCRTTAGICRTGRRMDFHPGALSVGGRDPGRHRPFRAPACRGGHELRRHLQRPAFRWHAGRRAAQRDVGTVRRPDLREDRGGPSRSRGRSAACP